MAFFFRSLSKSHRQSQNHRQTHRTFFDGATLKWVRDRGLDHAVEKESNLKPMINVKNLIKSEPSKSIPISIIAENRDTLNIPIRPIDFIRRYPSIFEEFLPGGIGVNPHIRLSPEVLNLDAEEQLIYQSDSHRREAADRLLKLLMLTRINKMPLTVVDRLKWDLGLPQDYEQTLVPEFPDYFQIIGTKEGLSGSDDKRVLELVCWSNELATSVMEKKSMNGEMGYMKGMPIAFPLQYSRGFEMDKKFKKWVDEWQKLPYISPYENASHLSPKSDESDKWAVAVLHELLHILVPKKTERDNILWLGEYLGLRSRFKRALLYHPGIFYLSSKIGTHTVVLKEAYKRDLLVGKHQLMGMRYQYIHLMNTVKEVPKLKSVAGGSDHQQQQKQHCMPRNSIDGGKEEEDESGELYDSSDSERGDASDDDYDDGEEGDDDVSQTGARKNVAVNRGRIKKTNLVRKGSWRNPVRESSVSRYPAKTKEKGPSKVSKRTEMHGRDNVRGRSSERSDFPRSRGRSLPASRTFT